LKHLSCISRKMCHFGNL